MPKSISKDTPLYEITLRKYEKPYNSSRRDMVRKVCLSIGLLQPGDSRDVIVDILSVLLSAKEQKKTLTSDEIKERVMKERRVQKIPIKGVADSNIRRQLKRLKDIYIVENIKNDYRITDFEDLHTIFDKRIKEFYLKNILERVEEHFKSIK